jgi:FixJ family two-component response regulator
MNPAAVADDKKRNLELLQQFKPVHKQIARLYVLGKSNKEIGEAVGWHQSSVYSVLRSDLVKAEIARMEGNIDNIMFEADLRMKSLVHRSLDVLERVLGDDDMDKLPAGDLNQQIRVAEKVLDGVLGMRRGDNATHVTTIQNIQQIMIDAGTKSNKDLTKDVMARIKAAKDVTT